ncbi:MAG: DNA-binding protein [Candidatus Coatesbacteria bacterium]|nr:MAG: DNA-binding protein [Candidatus Coatesbacteria bacterium]
MSGPNYELAVAWLRKADHDLITAKQTLLLPDGPTDTVCFHTQQAVEKALKAVLVWNQVPFPKTHNLIRLMDLALGYMPGLERYRQDFAQMSIYSTEVRYPDDWFEPARDDANHSLAVAEEIVVKVRKLLSEGRNK